MIRLLLLILLLSGCTSVVTIKTYDSDLNLEGVTVITQKGIKGSVRLSKGSNGPVELSLGTDPKESINFWTISKSIGKTAAKTAAKSVRVNLGGD